MDSHQEGRAHAAVVVQVGSWKTAIDTAIAPLIREMWIAGIETSMSCQGEEGGKIWIEFPELNNLIRFLDITAKYEAGTETLYNRMNYLLRLEDPSLCWDYDLFACDAALIWPDSNDENGRFQHEGPPCFFFTYSVRFPFGDLTTVLQRLQDYNRRATYRR